MNIERIAELCATIARAEDEDEREAAAEAFTFDLADIETLAKIAFQLAVDDDEDSDEFRNALRRLGA
jgi:hypothetical protein